MLYTMKPVENPWRLKLRLLLWCLTVVSLALLYVSLASFLIVASAISVTWTWLRGGNLRKWLSSLNPVLFSDTK
jgi:hypothetical protein